VKGPPTRSAGSGCHHEPLDTFEVRSWLESRVSEEPKSAVHWKKFPHPIGILPAAAWKLAADAWKRSPQESGSASAAHWKFSRSTLEINAT
jgi:hypothetical protein